jgi:hypothetical protein
MENDVVIVPNIRKRFNKKALLVKGLGTIVTLAGVSIALPLIVNAFFGGMTLIGLGAVAVLGGLGSKFLPYLGQMTENRVLSLRKGEARKNPIEQLQGNYIRGCAARDKKKEILKEYATEIKNMEGELSQTKQDFPDQNWSETETAISAAQQDYDDQEQAFAELEESLVATDKIIKVWDRKLRMADKTQRLRNIGGNTREDVTNEILNDVATTEITSRLNSAMAAMQVDKGVKERRAAIQANGNKKLTEKPM